MCLSNADRGPPGTVTTTRAPGASRLSELRTSATGSSTCSSTSEQTACVAAGWPSASETGVSRSRSTKCASTPARAAAAVARRTPSALYSAPQTSTCG